MSSVVGPEVSALISDLHRRHGVDLRTNVTAVGLEDGESGLRLRLSDGSSVSAEPLVCSVGVRPDVEWLEGSGIDIDNGIVCDEFGRTSVPNIWAIGDAAAWRDQRSGGNRRVEHWTNASEQAVTVAHNMVAIPGDERTLQAEPYFWSDQYDVKLQAVGTLAGAEKVRVGIHAPTGKHVALYSQGGSTVGALTLGAPRILAKLRQHVQDQTPVDEAWIVATGS